MLDTGPNGAINVVINPLVLQDISWKIPIMDGSLKGRFPQNTNTQKNTKVVLLSANK